MAYAAESREVSDEDEKLAADWQKRIEAALSARKDDVKAFERNRKLLRGIDPDSGNRMRTNLHFANLAAMRPQVYAKDPEFACSPTRAVPEASMPAARALADTAEVVVSELLVKRAKLKKRAKRMLTGAYACSISWLKVTWQEDRKKDALVLDQLKDAQDNLERLQHLSQQAEEAGSDNELKRAELQETIKGLEAKPEIVVNRGVTADVVMPDDMLVLDASVREITDYERADALAHRVWMTREQHCQRFGFDPKKGRVYREGQGGAMTEQKGVEADKQKDLLAVWEAWDQASGRVYTVTEGEEGFTRPPYSPDWTGKRWYPFFLLCFNEVDACYLPLSDVYLTEAVVKEYNKARDDFEKDRRDSRPVNIARKGGALTPDDVQRIRNRDGMDVILIEGVGGRPISDDLFMGQLGQINPANYDTAPARQDMEMLSGGGDNARGSVMKAKTATEAEILAQGLRGRSAERTDAIEDMLTEAGNFVLEIALRKLTPDEVKEIAGQDAVWPQISSPEDVFKQITLSVRGGSTGKPDRLQEQDRWTNLLPVIKEAMKEVAALRAAGRNAEAEAVVELVRETLRRFDERIDLQRFMPEPAEGEEPGQQQIPPELMQKLQELEAQVAELTQALQDKQAEIAGRVREAEIGAAADVQIARDTAAIKKQSDVEVAQINAMADALEPPEPEGDAGMGYPPS